LLQARLLREAALVCAAGPALAHALAPHGRRVDRLFRAVDAAHFAPAALAPGASEAQEAARLLGGLPGPRISHVGRIGTHVGLALLAAFADARPHWQIVLIGPVAPADGTPLPQRPNLHWLGAQPYNEDAAGFVRSCEAALQRSGAPAPHAQARIQAMLAGCSWEGRAQSVRALLRRLPAARTPQPAADLA
jgi:hypothetical protein